MKKENNLLLVQCYETGALKSDFLYRKPNKYRKHLLEKYPEMKTWLAPQIFKQVEPWPRELNMTTLFSEPNVSGHFIKNNIQTPTKVIDGSITPERLQKELCKDNYTHVGFTIVSNDYRNFFNCVQVVKTYDPSIKTIAGGYGAMWEGVEEYVDYCCIGRGVPFLRELFKEDLTRPYKITIIPDTLRFVYLNKEFEMDQCRIVTTIGCPFKCDFCGTNALFDGKYSGIMFSPKEVHDALVNYKNSLHTERLKIFWAEPTSLFKLNWWYELFDLFRADDGDYAMFVAGPSRVLSKLDLEKVSNSAARIGYVNIGVESFNKHYLKNSDVNIKKLIGDFKDYGISTYATYIIGFDFDTREQVWKDMDKLIELDADMYSVLNLHPIPRTTTWEKLKSENRLLTDIPPDFYLVHGFQSYYHPTFKPGFEDIFPLLCDIYKFIEKEVGSISLNMVHTYKNLMNHTSHPKIIKRERNFLKGLCKHFFPYWKDFFNPNMRQIERYTQIIK